MRQNTSRMFKRFLGLPLLTWPIFAQTSITSEDALRQALIQVWSAPPQLGISLSPQQQSSLGADIYQIWGLIYPGEWFPDGFGQTQSVISTAELLRQYLVQISNAPAQLGIAFSTKQQDALNY